MKNLVKTVLTIFALSSLIYSCNEVDSLEEDYILDVPDNNINEAKKTFFDKAKTFELLEPISGRWQRKHGYVQTRTSPVELDKTISFVEQLDSEMEEKYAARVMDNFGYPFWDGYVIYENPNNQNFTVVVPVFEANSTEINALISYSETENNERSYALMSKPEMVAIASNPKDPNFHFYTEIFQDFDIDLFANQNTVYDDWSSLVIDANTLCYITLVCKYPGGPCVETCSSNCTYQLLASGIVDTPVESGWVSGNCQWAAAINGFLLGNETVPIYLEAAQVLLDIGLAETLDFSEFYGLVNAMEDFLLDINDQSNIEALFDYFQDNSLNIFSLDAFSITSGSILSPNPPLWGNWADMNGVTFFTSTNDIRNGLIANYASQAQRIDGWWPCRVLGPAQEDGCLESLGLPLGNTEPVGYNWKPDGLIKNNLFGNFSTYEVPFFIEVKGKYGNWASGSAIFDYSNQIDQFNNYVTYLSDPTINSFSTCTARHGLWMILPANVTLSNDIINTCSNFNIPIYWSGIEYNVDNNSEIRVKSPELQNIAALNYSCLVFEFVGDNVMEWAMEQTLRNRFDYDAAIIPFLYHANVFEESFLVPNTEPDPYPDGCEG